MEHLIKYENLEVKVSPSAEAVLFIDKHRSLGDECMGIKLNSRGIEICTTYLPYEERTSHGRVPDEDVKGMLLSVLDTLSEHIKRNYCSGD